MRVDVGTDTDVADIVAVGALEVADRLGGEWRRLRHHRSARGALWRDTRLWSGGCVADCALALRRGTGRRGRRSSSRSRRWGSSGSRSGNGRRRRRSGRRSWRWSRRWRPLHARRRSRRRVASLRESNRTIELLVRSRLLFRRSLLGRGLRSGRRRGGGDPAWRRCRLRGDLTGGTPVALPHTRDALSQLIKLGVVVAANRAVRVDADPARAVALSRPGPHRLLARERTVALAEQRLHGREARLRRVEAEEVAAIGSRCRVDADDTRVAESQPGRLDVPWVVVPRCPSPRLDGALAWWRRDATRGDGLLADILGLLVDGRVANRH